MIFFLLYTAFLVFGERPFVDIRTSRINRYGSWGKWETCPDGTYVKGFRLKVEEKQGDLEDDTAMNGVRLYCAAIDKPLNLSVRVSSYVAPWGKWKVLIECYGGNLMTGIQMRVEPPKGLEDDTAANNMNMICSDKKVHGGDGLDWGYWSDWYHCPPKMAVCGLRTQVEFFNKMQGQKHL